MITKEQIKEASKGYLYGDEQRAFAVGAQWAAEKLQAENEKLQTSAQEGAELIVKWVKAYGAEKAHNIRLSGENARLRELLHDVASQIKSFSEITNGGKIPSIWRPIVNEIENALK